MRILLVTFYYPPDLSAGAFRTAALVKALTDLNVPDLQIDIFTTQPNRYRAIAQQLDFVSKSAQTTIHRFALPRHRSGMTDQALAFASFARQVLQATRGQRWDLVVATSSRLMTADLGRWVAARSEAPLYLDVRDLFTDTMNDVLQNSPVRMVLAPILARIERKAFRSASRINIVSEGFVDHIQRVAPRASVVVHPNGIDDEFLEAHYHASAVGRPRRRILYAGNIGEGQGLEHILPQAARLLGDRARFRIIGDGGRRVRLEHALTGLPQDSVELQPPMARAALINEYREADVLFLHLNDYAAFERVLPSKIFEYAATGKPILAGVRGYAAQFLRTNVPAAAIFQPGSAEGLLEALNTLPTNGELIDRAAFVAQFSRRKIMRCLAEDIIALAMSKRRA